TLLQTDALVDEAIRLQLNRKGGGRGGALGAEQRRQAAQQLSPTERAELKLYLGALQNDGEVVAGEMVSLAGQPARPISDDEIVAGKKAFQKAQKYDAYDAEDAKWFDEDFLRMHADKVDRSDEASVQRRLAFERGSRTPEEIQREMSEEFVRVATAARDLEDYIPLSATGINNGRDAKIIGGASHIARREGSQVFHLDQHHSDRQRRLGGRGPVASTPLRLALKAYQTQGGSEGKGLTPEQMRAAGQVLTNRFRDPEKRTIALQYLLAMQYVNDKSAETGTAVPTTDLGGEAAPLPPPPVRSIGAGADVPDVAAWDAPAAAPPSPAARSRAARPPAPAETASPMGGVEQPERANPTSDMMSDGESDPYAESPIIHAFEPDPYAESPIIHALESPNPDPAGDARLQRREEGQTARDTLSRNFNAAMDPVVGMLSAADRALGTVGSSPPYSPSPESMEKIRRSGADMTPLPFGAGRGLDYSLVPSASPVVSAITPSTSFPTSPPAIAHANPGNRQTAKVIPAHGEVVSRGGGPIPALVPYMAPTTAFSDMLGGHLGPSTDAMRHKEDFGLYPDEMRLLYASTPQEEIDALFRERVAR
ncbi:MAG: hypothetical protein GY872_19195, partial [Roseibacillus sp.]|nr:hypothetical protein [Roseibacillus sp.]